MSGSKTWATVAAAFSVVGIAILSLPLNHPAVKVVVALATFAFVTLLYTISRAAAQTAENASCAGASSEAIAAAIEDALEGRKADSNVLGGKLADAVDKVSERIENLSDELSQLSPSDELTSLVKEEVFNNVLWREFNRATRYKTPLTIAMIDVSPATDDCLRDAAGLILRLVRETDVAARYGERFAVVMPETGKQGAGEFAVRLAKAAEEEFAPTNGGGLRIKMAVGAASLPEDAAKTAPDLVAQSSTALEKAMK